MAGHGPLSGKLSAQSCKRTNDPEEPSHPDGKQLPMRCYPQGLRAGSNRSSAQRAGRTTLLAVRGCSVWQATRDRSKGQGPPRSCERTYMKSTGESASLPETSDGKAAEGNCVAARRGGEQPEADPRSRTKGAPIRPVATASLLRTGEACRMGGDRASLIPRSTGRNGLPGVVGAGTRGRPHVEALGSVRARRRASGSGQESEPPW